MQAQQPSAVPTQTPVQVQVPQAGAMMMPPHAAAVGPRPGYAAVPNYPPNAGQVVVHQPIPMMKAMSMAPPVGAPIYLQGPGAAVRPMGAPQMAMAMGMPMAQPMPMAPRAQPMAQPVPQMMAQPMVQPMPMQAQVLSGAPLSPQRGLSPPRAVSPMRAAAPMYAAAAAHIPAAQATAGVSGLRAVSPVRSSVSPMRGGVVYSTSTGYTPRMQDLPRHQGEHRVIGERRITREELAETGNLVEVEGSVVPTTERPSSLLMRPVSQVTRVPDPFLPGREVAMAKVLTSDSALAGSTYPYGQNEQVADFGGRVPSPKGDMPGSDMLNFEQPEAAPAMYMEPAMGTGQEQLPESSFH